MKFISFLYYLLHKLIMIEVLRLSHRLLRDQRISTHVALVARAFGASKMYYSGTKDKSLEESVIKVIGKFGGPFSIEYEKKDIELIKNKKLSGFKIVHLTMFGKLIQNRINNIKRTKNIFIIVGGEKVEGEVYKLADFNIAITSQPHSEVSSLAIFFDRYFNGMELDFKFSDAKVEIIPQDMGKLLKKI